MKLTICPLPVKDKWSGTFAIKWVFIKDIPNNQYRHIVLTNNENKPVTNSRDTQEVLLEPGREMLRIFHQYKSKTSILDDFGFYDKRQELMEQRTQMQQGMPQIPNMSHGLPQGAGAGLVQNMAQQLSQPITGQPPVMATIGGLLPPQGIPPGGMLPRGMAPSGMGLTMDPMQAQCRLSQV